MLIPAAAPSILVARLSLGVALVMAVIAEMLGNPQGLGYAIIREMQAFQPEKMFADVLVVGALGIALNAAVLAASRWAFLAISGGWSAMASVGDERASVGALLRPAGAA